MQKLKADDIIYLSESVLRTLTQNRITTLVEFLQEDISKLATITKLNLPQILAIRNEIFAKYSAPVICGSVLLERSIMKSRYLCTGIERQVPNYFIFHAFSVAYMKARCFSQTCLNSYIILIREPFST